MRFLGLLVIRLTKWETLCPYNNRAKFHAVTVAEIHVYATQIGLDRKIERKN